MPAQHALQAGHARGIRLVHRPDPGGPGPDDVGPRVVDEQHAVPLDAQVADDVVVSAFRSAGQRCSALRILFLQEDVANGMLKMIEGAAAELKNLGDGGVNAWLEGYIFSLSGPIYAGTNEVQRNIIAERILGLPREPKGAGR